MKYQTKQIMIPSNVLQLQEVKDLLFTLKELNDKVRMNKEIPLYNRNNWMNRIDELEDEKYTFYLLKKIYASDFDTTNSFALKLLNY